MTLLWRPQLNTGNEMIDSDHRHLVCLMNTIELALNSGEHADILSDAVDQLIDYTHAHFAHEERIMIALRYKGFDAHKAKHDDLKREIARIHAELRAGDREHPSPPVIDRLTKLLRNWLIDHIIKDDFQLKPLLATKTPEFTANYS